MGELQNIDPIMHETHTPLPIAGTGCQYDRWAWSKFSARDIVALEADIIGGRFCSFHRQWAIEALENARRMLGACAGRWASQGELSGRYR